MTSLATALALACGVALASGAASTAQAAPLSVAPAGLVSQGAIETVAYGCGPGWVPNRWGQCRPMYRPYGYGYGRPRFYGPRPFYGPRYGYYRPRPPILPFF
ncbi:hypothetical protein G3T14_03895 [Methylobacterium sp. BTF04]|uniref:GCG_CRPN prefix-to-repeats domain-containing protein n=1 Tax=Methylobacterium sp. BTF04 TaxID=2708300 RepID=UPI0013D2A90C|nr:hypothetical protein [Methylobacterium sp. BTF04]NEU11268.1 hypothetical protein [Methylobacterium sp. BTF04]